MVVPIRAATHETLAGLLVAGVSTRRPLDAAYRAFLETVAGHIGTALGGPRAYEEERQRAAAVSDTGVGIPQAELPRVFRFV